VVAPVSAPPAGPVAIDRLVEQHTRRFPWYAGLVAASGPDLPLVDEAVLERHYYTGPQLPDAEVYLTSGTSSGLRKRIQYCAADDDRYVAQRRDLFARFLGPDLLGARRAGVVAVSDLGTGHAAASARRIFVELGLDARDIPFEDPLDTHVERLNRWRPDVLFTMPMILDQLLQAPRPLTARPSRIIVVGDLAPPAWRVHIASRFGIGPQDLLDVVGSVEVGAIAYYDVAAGEYVFHDHITPEVVDAHGAVRDEGDGVLVLTSSARDYFPAVRYVTGDLVAGLRRRQAGNGVVAGCERFLGRVGGDLKHGERISAYDLSQAMATVFPGCPFEVDEGESLHIRVVAAGVTDEQREAVRKAIRLAAPDVATMLDAGLVGAIDVSTVSLDTLRSSRGKRRFHLRDD
jgi:phenylacetate-coenzyme A ligase PaaK-like adenylate-forming protein